MYIYIYYTYAKNWIISQKNRVKPIMIWNHHSDHDGHWMICSVRKKRNPSFVVGPRPHTLYIRVPSSKYHSQIKGAMLWSLHPELKCGPYTLPETNSKFAPENWWLEDEFPFLFGGDIIFSGTMFQGGYTWKISPNCLLSCAQAFEKVPGWGHLVY